MRMTPRIRPTASAMMGLPRNTMIAGLRPAMLNALATPIRMIGTTMGAKDMKAPGSLP